MLPLQSHVEKFPQIYAYTTPDVTTSVGWLKIGYTERKSTEERVKEQTQTVNVRAVLAWKFPAKFSDGKYFKDKDFHRYLIDLGFTPKRNEYGGFSEWFNIDADAAQKFFKKFCKNKGNPHKPQPYELRAAQEDAVTLTLNYFRNGGKKFLWNAKPRFGKTLTAYDLVRRLKAKKILIVTNRPAIFNSWYTDFAKFIEWQTKYKFVTSNSELLRKYKNIWSYDKYFAREKRRPPIIAFESLQNLKGAEIFGGKIEKLHKLENFDWDLLIIDESHEGVDTEKTQTLFSKISRKWTLYLSGTPFKALANKFFRADEIFNWSYEDEQRAKNNWTGESANPYADLPQMTIFSYQMSNIIAEKINRGIDIDAGHYDYAFDLNEFFSTQNKKFIHEDDVKIFLDTLSTLEKFPFSTPELRDELKHTFWLFHRVESVKAMAKLLKNHPIFKDYYVVVAAGNDADESGVRKSFDKVTRAIKQHDKTITLSVGQLTTGVTVPEWTAVFMLSNLKSAAEYMQAAFRAQNPNSYVDDNGKLFCKENCYVFDFAPERTLTIYDEFANNLNPASSNRKKNIGELLNFFPVFAEDTSGSMAALDAEKILSLPQKIKAHAVYESNFQSNYLFANISNVFGAPSKVKEILYKLVPDETPNDKKSRGTIELAGKVPLKPKGDVPAHFGKKIYSVEVKNFANEIVDGLKAELNFDGKQTSKFKNIVAAKVDETFHDTVAQIDSATRETFIGEMKREIETVIEHDKAKELQRSAEDEVRAHLRGFSRTIPSFLMAYGGERDDLTLKNFDDNISDEVFVEVTGITKAEFHFLRDGGDIDGVHFEGGFFDEIVFNAAVQEFLLHKRELAEYFNHRQHEDIFDHIPPQRTNQIFTPRNVVCRMLDALETENPNIFDDPNAKFLDLYMKSGMFIAEIVKRLFNSPKLRKMFPANRKRLEHILTRQVYGFAPTEIIHRIVTEYLFGAKITRTIPQHNFICADTSQAVINGNLRGFIKKNLFTAVFKLIKSKERVQKFGEVFTPVGIVGKMLDVINDQATNINVKILEPTFGEGVFLTQILQRRLDKCTNESDILTALSNLYGVELQADNVKSARQNLLALVDDKVSNKDLLHKILEFNFLEGDFLARTNASGKKIFFRDWEIPSGNFITFTLDEVQFQKNFNNVSNFIIVGNPPYQVDAKGGNKNYAAPIYHKFLDAAYDISNEVLMIHPARFLFNAGGTPKDFNKKMLNDEHFKVLEYFPDASEIFNGVDIKGGVAITYRNANKIFPVIGTYTHFTELNSILHKVTSRADFQPLSKMVYSTDIYHFTEKLHEDFPNARENLSEGHDYDLKTNIFSKLPEVFLDDKPNDGNEYLKFLGLVNVKRVYKWIRRDYVKHIPLLDKYKIILPKSNGSGAIGEVLSTPLVGVPLVGVPLVGSTQTFISIGLFDNIDEANAALKYVKTKFARAMLGVLKVTQHNPAETWAKVPQQNFRADSDIDWTASVAAIDAQLYEKYGLTAEEINFIEEKVRAME